MLKINDNVAELPGVGFVIAKQLDKIGVRTIRDLVYYYPARHEDYSKKVRIADIQTDDRDITIQGQISIINNRRSPRKRTILTEAIVEDETGKIKVVWFRQPFIKKLLKVGDFVSLSGKVDSQYGLHMQNPMYEKITDSKDSIHTARIVPIYSITKKLTQKRLRNLVKTALGYINEITDWLPEKILLDQNLIPLRDALRKIHFPDLPKDEKQALDRLKFDELFLHQLANMKARHLLEKMNSPSIIFNEDETKRFVNELPFTLTDSQRRSSWEILQDMTKGNPMNRLLEGDVGSGKTVVAAIAANNAIVAGYQVVYLAPTEILATQQYESLSKYVGDNSTVALLTRSQSVCQSEDIAKAELKKRVKEGRVSLIVGTHALLQDDTAFHKLGFIIIDEQHRFGVRQRQALREAEHFDSSMPHLLSMSATPIPRSLALALYGDLKLSIIDELPKGRKQIITSFVSKRETPSTYRTITKHLDNGEQMFYVCPLIDPSDFFGAESVGEAYEKLSKGSFAKYKIAILHGKIKPTEKQEIMSDFVSGKIDILISTTVIEVGVDVPNATVMFIDGAERFGLAQLHQLRGRVGRGDKQSYCYLHSTSLSHKTHERLSAVAQSTNGFELAERDLAMRGPGEMYGVEQSGVPEFRIAKLTDVVLIKTARSWAEKLFAEEGDLDGFPLLRDKVESFISNVHFE